MHETRRMALLSIVTSLVTLALKFGAYFMTGSVGQLSDALEAFVNLAAGTIAFGALTIAALPADDSHSYGHEKVEYFSSGVEGLLILVAAGSIVYAAVPRLWQPVSLQYLGPGVAVSLLAAAANFFTSRVMLKSAKTHDSIVLEADARHLMTDVWTSLAVVAGLLVLWAKPGWYILDPLIALAVAGHIVYTGFDLLRRSTHGLMDASLPAEELRAIDEAIAGELPPEANYHALRTRKAGASRFIEFHLTVPGETRVDDSHALCDRIEAALERALPNTSVTIHVEPEEHAEAHGPGGRPASENRPAF